MNKEQMAIDSLDEDTKRKFPEYASGHYTGYLKGFDACMSSANSNFDEMICSEWQKTLNEHDLFQVKNIWSLARISADKEIAELKAENEFLKEATKNHIAYSRKLETQNKIAKEALEYYRDVNSYNRRECECTHVAQEALSKIKE